MLLEPPMAPAATTNGADILLEMAEDQLKKVHADKDVALEAGFLGPLYHSCICQLSDTPNERPPLEDRENSPLCDEEGTGRSS